MRNSIFIIKDNGIATTARSSWTIGVYINTRFDDGLFDIKINAQYPVTAPLPLGTQPAEGWGFCSFGGTFTPSELQELHATLAAADVDIRS